MTTPRGSAVTPVRIQLSRAKGFNLQAASVAVNGLPCVKVDRSTRFGNPLLCTPHGCELRPCGCRESFRCCVSVFRRWVLTRSDQGSLRLSLDGLNGHPRHTKLVAGLPSLRGKNLACWCEPGAPCHADVLLEIANADPAPPVELSLSDGAEVRATESDA